MLAGCAVCVYYMLRTSVILGSGAAGQWFHIAPISAGIFGVPAGLLTMAVVSLLTPAPAPQVDALVDYLRAPED
jgi:cation/acetate symporter